MTDHNHHPQTNVFERINEFMGAHVECIFDERRVQYDFSFVAESDACVITLRCGCGATASLLTVQSVGYEIAIMTRSHDIPMTERITAWAAAPTLLEA